MKNINKNFLLLIVLFFCGCKGQKEENRNIDITQDGTINNSYFQLQKVIEKKDETVFKYSDTTFELKSNEGESNLLINNEEFITKLILDNPDFNIWYYKKNEDKIILLEGNDYYSSTFYAYHLYNNKLFYLGNFTIKQPNIEKEQSNKKEFRIYIEKNNIVLETLLNGKFTEKKIFSDKINQVKSKKNTISKQAIGAWSTDCQGTPNLIIQENKSFFLCSV